MLARAKPSLFCMRECSGSPQKAFGMVEVPTDEDVRGILFGTDLNAIPATHKSFRGLQAESPTRVSVANEGHAQNITFGIIHQVV